MVTRWGSTPQSACHGRRVVRAGMRGLTSEGPVFRRERELLVQDRASPPPGCECRCRTSLLMASGRVVSHAAGPGR